MNSKTKSHTIYKDKDGKRVKSVTGIINKNLGWNKAVLIGWSRKMAMQGDDPNKVRDKSADIGTLAHYMIECQLTGEKADLDEYSKNDIEKANNALDAFHLWWDKAGLEFRESEMRLVSEAHKYGGTIDLVARKENELYLIDFKTANGIYREHVIQLSAYYHLYEEVTKNKIHETYILQLSKDSDAFHIHRISKEQIKYGWEAFGLLINLGFLEKVLKV